MPSPVATGLFCVAAWGLASTAAAQEHSGHAGHGAMGDQLPMWTLVPFAAMLLAIAVLPLTTPHWWEHNRNKGIVAALLSVPLALYLVVVWGEGGTHELLEKGMEYLSFLLLLGSLFVISGGIYVQGSLSGTPLVNTALIGLGGLLASFIGTTGASMVLIRPILRANASRTQRAHIVVFFIFVVSNCGGLLTPLGDPPLFLGFLKGVPFEWTLQLWKEWLLVNGLLLVIFHIWDEVVLNREERQRPGSQLEQVMQHEPLRIKGLHNVLFLGGIVATIYAAGRGLGNAGQSWPYGIQEGLMLLIALVSYAVTSGEIRRSNHFGFGPIIEVAVLFAGIFVTMIPALLILNARGSQLGVDTPAEFFWATGVLSSFLDNAPTYLTFAATACGSHGVPLEGRYLATFLAQAGAGQILAAISCGAVFMGANTYIGNGPNFMVKAIAEENGVRMPSFFGYMLYSGAVLVPVFVIVTLVFFV
jgi:Na+/H+ antiporter NhaD/arsenite permease-like protein